MNKRQFALSAAAFAVALALVSCEPIRGHAVEISYEEQAGIEDYLQAGNTTLFNIDFRLDEDSDGKRSKRLQIYGLQSAMLSTQTQIYDNMDFSLAPSSVTVSGTSASGLYRSALDGELHGVTVRNPLPAGTYNGTVTATFATSDEFSYTITFVPDSNSSLQISGANYTYTPGMPVKAYGYYYKGRVICAGNAYFPSSDEYSSTLYTSHVFGCYLTQDSNVPTVSRYYSINSSYKFPSEKHMGAYGQNITLPSGDVPTSTPWEYYNEVLLPYIEEQFPDVPDLPDLLIFPDGYQEPEQPTTVPVEYPTLPGFDYALETNGTEPASDYNYNIPDLPGKDVAVPQFDFTQINPAEVMAPVADGLRGLWQLITMVLTEYGLFPYVGLAVFAAIVLMLLHLGK